MPDLIVTPVLPLEFTVNSSALSLPSVVVPIRKRPLESMRALGLPAVSNEIVSAAGNLIEVFVSPV